MGGKGGLEMTFVGTTFKVLRAANVARIPLFKNAKGERAHDKEDGSDWKLSAWSNATLGELGEAANLIKKVERGDLTLDQAREALAKEFADVVIYLDILAMQAGVDLGLAVREKFNEVSERVGAPVRIGNGGTLAYRFEEASGQRLYTVLESADGLTAIGIEANPS
jgi:NTP pyrophosphatase (non-canonical NTP hydrolase)